MPEILKSRYVTLTFPTDDNEKDRLIEHSNSIRCLEFIRGEIYEKDIKCIKYLFRFKDRRTIKVLTKTIIYEDMWLLHDKISDYKHIFNFIKNMSISEIIIGSNPNSKEKSWLNEEEKINVFKINNSLSSSKYYYSKKGYNPKEHKNIKSENYIVKKSKSKNRIKDIEEYCKLFPNDSEHFSHFFEKM